MPSDDLDVGDLPEAQAERLALVRALLERPELHVDAAHALRLRYPHLPDAVLHTASHHLYGDLPGALIDLLALLELSLRNPKREVGYGASIHALDHLYNWFQMQALLPYGLPELEALAREAETALADGDIVAARAALKSLRDRIDGDLSAPEFS